VNLVAVAAVMQAITTNFGKGCETGLIPATAIIFLAG
jgi:hypothetical protein